VPPFTDSPDFVMAWVADREYDYWQNAEQLYQYTAAGRSYEGLPLISRGLPFPHDEAIIDTSRNPGRRAMRHGYIEVVGAVMWLGEPFWRLTGVDKKQVSDAGWLRILDVSPSVTKLEAAEHCFTAESGNAELQARLRLLLFRPRNAARLPNALAPLDPSKPYSVYCRDFDVEIEAENLVSALRLRPVSSEVLRATIESGLAAWRVRHDFAALEATSRIRSTVTEEVLKDSVISLLLDHSDSMRGQKMLLAAGAAMMASDLLDGLGVKHDVLGFTTVRWRGGLSRQKWLRSGQPPYPGRLNDVLHVIYCSAGERLKTDHCVTMLHPDLLKENLDGEAIQWATSRLRERGESRKFLIVVSDGAPVDDSTLYDNGAEYLVNHFRSVIHAIAQEGDIQLAAIGINYGVDRYYQRSVVIHSPDDLGAAVLQLIEQLLCAPQAST